MNNGETCFEKIACLHRKKVKARKQARKKMSKRKIKKKEKETKKRGKYFILLIPDIKANSK